MFLKWLQVQAAHPEAEMKELTVTQTKADFSFSTDNHILIFFFQTELKTKRLYKYISTQVSVQIRFQISFKKGNLE